MQALFLFALYGLFYAVIMAVMTSGSTSALELKDIYIKGTATYFEQFENLTNQHLVPSNLRIAILGTNVTPYLNQTEARQKLNWNLGKDATTDPWGTPFTGFVTHQRIAVRGQPSGGQVQLPISAFVLVSAGPDLQIHPTLQARLNRLSSSSSIRSLLNIEAVAGSDDIVHTFSTQQAATQRWRDVEARVNEIAQAAARQYNSQYQTFLQRLRSRYGDNYTQFFNNRGELQFTTANINTWRSAGVINASNPLPDMLNFQSRDAIGAPGAFDLIESDTNLIVRLKAYRSTGSIGNANCTTTSRQSYSDTLRICVNNNGSPWGDSRGQLFYYQDIKGEKT